MAVKYYQDSGSGLGGILGGLATLGGILTGQPLLPALGTGLNVMSGGNGAAGALGGALVGESGSMSDIFNNILTGKWKIRQVTVSQRLIKFRTLTELKR